MPDWYYRAPMTFSSSMRLVSRIDGRYLSRPGTVWVLEILNTSGLLSNKIKFRMPYVPGFSES
jgi:hypothetical protein